MATVTTVKKFDWNFFLKNFGAALLGTVSGGILGGAAGRFSGVAGIAATGLGFHLLEKKSDKKWIGYFVIGTGVSMIASPMVAVNPSQVKGLEGFEGFVEDAKEGATTALKSLGLKMFLDKTPLAASMGLKGIEDEISGLGNAQMSDAEAQKVIAQLISEEKAVRGFDDLDGIDGAEDLEGLEGNDDLEGIDGNEDLDGFEGDEDLNGIEGNEDLDGIEGNDDLEGFFSRKGRARANASNQRNMYNQNRQIQSRANRSHVQQTQANLNVDSMSEYMKSLTGLDGEQELDGFDGDFDHYVEV